MLPLRLRFAALPVSLLLLAGTAIPQSGSSPRARGLGIPFDGRPGPLNAITDVRGVLVGHTTLISGKGKHAVRTGVTVVLPNRSIESVPGGFFRQNGNGEVTGIQYLEETGFLISPIVLTNTLSVGTAQTAVMRWSRKAKRPADPVSLPIVAETWDGWLNDIDGFHIREEHVFRALDGAESGPVAEGNVGGGTGMICHGFKGGIGTSSRVLSQTAGGYVVGVLVQANQGLKRELRIAGIPVGRRIPYRSERPDQDDGSIIVVVATDAPLLPIQLRRVARRVGMGLARCGSFSGTESGDMFLAFSTQTSKVGADGNQQICFVSESRLDEIFLATVQATEEAIINALVAAETMTGRSGHSIPAIPHDRLRHLLEQHGRLEKKASSEH
ncbi:MAG TPA: S58 family peptidase [Planctomycetes bacterium]|nr:S58 family peptidase [Planctomycetota bacterium]